MERERDRVGTTSNTGGATAGDATLLLSERERDERERVGRK